MSEKIRIRFASGELGRDLLKHGLVFRKSQIIEYPELSCLRLELAFLLGYYDGDGQQNTTRINSGSVRFLEQVKTRFGIPYKIQVNTRETEIYGRHMEGAEYHMCLGAELFNQMMRNYENSMSRKCWSPCDSNERRPRHTAAHTPQMIQRRTELQKEWRAVTKDKLEDLAQQMPLTHIAAKYNVGNPSTIAEKCRG